MLKNSRWPRYWWPESCWHSRLFKLNKAMAGRQPIRKTSQIRQATVEKRVERTIIAAPVGIAALNITITTTTWVKGKGKETARRLAASNSRHANIGLLPEAGATPASAFVAR